MQFQPLGLPGAWIVELEPVEDERGSFARNFCAREFAARGLVAGYVQHSRSFNRIAGCVRGMHLQKPPHGEAKLVSCIAGAIFDVCLDLRPASPSYLQWRGVELSAANRRQLYIPEGCAHGFQSLTDAAEVQYLISAEHEPSAAAGYRPEDPAFAITWPLPITMMSAKDRTWPDFVDSRS
ncbi:MAG: dTDP-4-dehydrorhamnose 3,5-epimerase family protein [Hyphomonadaceae bacterium]|nr:dTDP-4-dehydrorhamnose 3,5-epimerase family protein [Hyphomonadaceae bacterium]